MGLLASQWQGWARERALTYQRQRGSLARNEWMGGAYRGYLLWAGWAGARGAELLVVVRFPRVADPATVRDHLARDPGLAVLPAQGKRGAAGGFVVDETTVSWTRGFPWRRPRATAVGEWIERLIESVSRVAPPFTDRCEICGGTAGTRYVLFGNLPMFLCDSCQYRTVLEGRTAPRHA